MEKNNRTASGKSVVDSGSAKAGSRPRPRGRPQKESENPAIEANAPNNKIEGI
jgi:hypothetical protein